MWLINTTTLGLEEFYSSQAPPYAILSHTWGEEEVTFRDICSPSARSKKGFTKIAQTCHLAKTQGFDYAWIDTCCIDKSSSAELTESINSMFKWYENAGVCYAFLADLIPDSHELIGSCRWFTRGWTLQELLAPRRLDFYDKTWAYVGSKHDFVDVISKATRIHPVIISGDPQLSTCPVAMKMSWSAGRQTTREEDRAYCLLGIFNIAMPLIYGEGSGAFRRLQEEIIKRSNDLSIFAWESPELGLNQQHEVFLSPLAKSADDFINGQNVFACANDPAGFSITNNGILLSGNVQLGLYRSDLQKDRYDLYFLVLGRGHGGPVKITLRKIGPDMFHRDGRFPLTGVSRTKPDPRSHDGLLDNTPTKFHLVTDEKAARESLYEFRFLALHVPWENAEGTFRIRYVVPNLLWDPVDNMFLKPKPQSLISSYPVALCITVEVQLPVGLFHIVVLCDPKREFSDIRLFDKDHYREEAEILLADENLAESLSMFQVKKQAPRLFQNGLGARLEVGFGEHRYEVAAYVEKDVLRSRLLKEVKRYRLVLTAVPLSSNNAG